MSSRSYLHRDLKPSNIFIHNNSDLREIPADLDDIVIKIGDLGLTSKYDDVLSSVLCGTPGYIAPEVLKNSEFHPNSDMFSVGCILYQFMVGEALFSSTTREILMMKNTSFQIGELDSLYHTQQSNIQQIDIQFLKGLLHQDPELRLTGVEALQHEWFTAEESKEEEEEEDHVYSRINSLSLRFIRK